MLIYHKNNDTRGQIVEASLGDLSKTSFLKTECKFLKIVRKMFLKELGKIFQRKF